MKRSTVLSAVLIWVVVVAAAAGVTWAVIDAAGRNVLTTEDSTTTQSAPLPAGGDSAGPTGEPSASRSGRPSRRPVARPSGSPTTGTGTEGPAPGGESPPAGGAASRTRTWHGPAGSVVVRCTGATSRLISTTPGNGYRAEVESGGPGEIEVQFEGAAQEVRVDAFCAGGTPRFAVENREED